MLVNAPSRITRQLYDNYMTISCNEFLHCRHTIIFAHKAYYYCTKILTFSRASDTNRSIL